MCVSITDPGMTLKHRDLTVWGRVATSWNSTEVIFGIYKKYWAKKIPEGAHTLATRVGGAPPYWAHPLSRGTLERPPTDFFHVYIPIYPKNIDGEDRSGVPPPQASVATKNQSGPCSGTLSEGGSHTGGHLHHPGALHDEEGVVHPRGWGYVPVAMCLISLSLSLVFLRWYDLDVSRALLL